MNAVLSPPMMRCLLLLAVLGWSGSHADAEESQQVLFIGNSYTYQNDLPGMLAALGKAGGHPFVVDKSVAGGFTLEQHWRQEKALAKIQSRKWDYVVLQEQSQLPFVDPDRMHKFARLLDAEIEKQGAQTVFFLTWARQNSPDKQEAINQGYQTIAKDLDAQVSPVGIAWQQALAADDELALYKSDKSHPTKAGTYLAACVFYATLTGESPVSLPGRIGGLSDEAAKLLQETAWVVVQAQASN